MRQFLVISKALADSSRASILLALRDHELCLCQLIEMLQLSPATVSKHMSLLALAGLVDVRKEGRWHYYRLPAEPSPEVAAALEFLGKALGGSKQAKESKTQVRQVLKMDKEALCCHYKG